MRGGETESAEVGEVEIGEDGVAFGGSDLYEDGVGGEGFGEEFQGDGGTVHPAGSAIAIGEGLALDGGRG